MCCPWRRGLFCVSAMSIEGRLTFEIETGRCVGLHVSIAVPSTIEEAERYVHDCMTYSGSQGTELTCLTYSLSIKYAAQETAHLILVFVTSLVLASFIVVEGAKLWSGCAPVCRSSSQPQRAGIVTQSGGRWCRHDHVQLWHRFRNTRRTL